MLVLRVSNRTSLKNRYYHLFFLEVQKKVFKDNLMVSLWIDHLDVSLHVYLISIVLLIES